MKEIRFRAWDREYAKFCYADKFYQELQKKYFDDIRDWGHGEAEQQLSKGGFGELQISTGFKDKSGKEIYEGDILCNPSQDGKRDDIGVVVYCKRDMGLECEFKASKVTMALAEFVEVIGNIYENEELVKKIEESKH